MSPEQIAEQARAILRVWQESGRTVLAGPTIDGAGNATGWFARVERGPVFRGQDLTDALAQLTTWLALGAEV
jgi:hypothetical protein